MPEMVKTPTANEPTEDFDEVKDDLEEAFEKANEDVYEETLTEAPKIEEPSLSEHKETEHLEEPTLESAEKMGFFAALRDKIKNFFKDIKEKITDAVNIAHNKRVMGKENYYAAVAKEYNEAHNAGKVDLLDGSHREQKTSTKEQVDKNATAKELMTGESALEKVQNPPKDFNVDQVYDATITKVLPEKNLVIISVLGQEERLHKSELGKNMKIKDLKVGDEIEVAYIGKYKDFDNFSVKRAEELFDKAKTEPEKDIEQYSSMSEPYYTDFSSVAPNLTDAELAEIFGYDLSEKETESEAEYIPPVHTETKTENENTPPAVENSISETAEPVSSAKNYVCYDVEAFNLATTVNTERTVALIGGKGETELVAEYKEGEWTFMNSDGKKISNEKAFRIASQHKNVSNIEKVIFSYLMEEKNIPDRAESAFEPTVFKYQDNAVLVTQEGKVITVSPEMPAPSESKEMYSFNKRGIEQASAAIGQGLSRNSLDREDIITVEEPTEEYIDINIDVEEEEIMPDNEVRENGISEHNSDDIDK